MSEPRIPLEEPPRWPQEEWETKRKGRDELCLAVMSRGRERWEGKLKKCQVAADEELRVENCCCSNGPVPALALWSKAHL